LLGTPTRTTLAYHVLAGVGAVVVVAILATLLTARLARQETDEEARRIARSLATGLIAPMVTAGVRAGRGPDLVTLDRVIHARLAGSTVVRVKIWSVDGDVLYSNEADLIGRRFGLRAVDVDVLRPGGLQSRMADPGRPENQFERGLGALLEVRSRAVDVTGQPVLVQVDFSVRGLQARADALRDRILPVVLAGIVLLELLLLPLSVWLSRRSERAERARVVAEQQALQSALTERRTLAAHLHDGVIQDLSAVGYALQTVSQKLQGRDGADVAPTVDRTSGIIRSDIALLRGLTSSLYTSLERAPEPSVDPDSQVELGPSVRALAEVLAADGVTAELGELPPVPSRVAAAVLQVAREAVRNAVKHSGDCPHLTIGVADGQLVLSVVDAGIGYRPDQTPGRREGHLGLTLLQDAADKAHGRLDTHTAPGAGTTVRLVVDLDDLGADRWPHPPVRG
jgi:two-component system NarL family sensor kinase